MVVGATLFKEANHRDSGNSIRVPSSVRVPIPFSVFKPTPDTGRLLVRYAPQNLTPLFCTTRSDQAALDLVLFVDLTQCFGF
jgi:hypothetical protein